MHGLLELLGRGGGGGGWCPCNGKSSQGFPVDNLVGCSCPWRRNRRAQQFRGGGRSCSVDCPGMGALQASRAYLRSEAHRGHHVKLPFDCVWDGAYKIKHQCTSEARAFR